MRNINFEEKTKKEAKREFLINVYNQAFNNINRHITIVWQSVSVLVASFASLLLTEKYDMPLSLSYLILSIYITWMIAHLYDSNHWYTRNIHLVTNIERYFLGKKDKKHLHHFFTNHLTSKHIADTFKIQIYFAYAIWIISFLYASYKATLEASSLFFCFSIIISIICHFLVHLQYRKNKRNIEKLIDLSPGKRINF